MHLMASVRVCLSFQLFKSDVLKYSKTWMHTGASEKNNEVMFLVIFSEIALDSKLITLGD